jgi:hypothetical protein
MHHGGQQLWDGYWPCLRDEAGEGPAGFVRARCTASRIDGPDSYTTPDLGPVATVPRRICSDLIFDKPARFGRFYCQTDVKWFWMMLFECVWIKCTCRHARKNECGIMIRVYWLWLLWLLVCPDVKGEPTASRGGKVYSFVVIRKQWSTS